MTWSVDHFAFQAANCKPFAILEQMIEFRAIAGHVGRIEDRPKDALNVADMFADPNLRSSLELHVRRARQVVRVCVCLQHPHDLDPLLACGGKDRFNRRH